ncbi:MAG: DUF3006 domain-containing protein [Oscillospiraceae bacterium]|nr:DUF3006 domain-containing protein [Oscillospiraceae bacterium]
MLILERLRDDIAVISDEKVEFTVPADMAAGCKEGDVIYLSGEVYVTDTAATEMRKKEILSLQNSLWDE